MCLATSGTKKKTEKELEDKEKESFQRKQVLLET